MGFMQWLETQPCVLEVAVITRFEGPLGGWRVPKFRGDKADRLRLSMEGPASLLRLREPGGVCEAGLELGEMTRLVVWSFGRVVTGGIISDEHLPRRTRNAALRQYDDASEPGMCCLVASRAKVCRWSGVAGTSWCARFRSRVVDEAEAEESRHHHGTEEPPSGIQ